MVKTFQKVPKNAFLVFSRSFWRLMFLVKTFQKVPKNALLACLFQAALEGNVFSQNFQKVPKNAFLACFF